MPELTPLDDNRQEHFLNGEDLEPITRREHFYAGRESELPVGHQEPETREEWFIKKYRGGGGDVTVVPLSVTENGTYSEEGKAYSPVSVNVPLPQNAYLLKSVANLPLAIASFNDGEEMVMPSLKVAIEPQQEGSGDPSPTNIRPIIGWDEVDVTVADDVETPTVSNVYTIDLDGTRYGGTLDVVNGDGTNRLGYVDLGNLNFVYYENNKRFAVQLNDGKPSGSGFGLDTALCECYPVVTSQYGSMTDGSISIGSNFFSGSTCALVIHDENYTDATQLKASLNGKKVVYELSTPTTYDTQPTAIKSLRGVNNVYANTGDIKDAEYFSKEV